MNKKSELKELLLIALGEPEGIRLRVEAGDSNRTQLALAALKSAKRELTETEPEAINLLIKVIRKDEIAIYNPSLSPDLNGASGGG